MIEKTLAELESKIRATGASDSEKQELLNSVTTLKAQLQARDEQQIEPLKNSVGELRDAVDGFEKSHPKLVQIVNNISNNLANWGI